MRLSDLLSEAERAGLPADPSISGLTADSREVTAGMLFAALPGTQADGTRFIGSAVSSGAAALLVATDAAVDPSVSVPVVRAADPRERLAHMAALYHAPQPAVAVAVTGTNGKTSVASFVEQIWRDRGLASASIGTLGLSTAVAGADTLPHIGLTSPDPVTLHRALQGLAGVGVTHVALEASSHGLAQRRLVGVRLAGGAFTNISRDHLDYHPTFEDYLTQKMRLFRDLLPPGARAVINADAEGGAAALAASRDRGLEIVTVGRGEATIRMAEVAPTGSGLRLSVETRGGKHDLELPLVGAFQAWNAVQAAALAAVEEGLTVDDTLPVLERLKGAVGRLEHVGTGPGGGDIYVDYAHTPDALASALVALRPHCPGRLIVVFGAGGDRDPGKRPLMGAAARDHADLAIVTDDNPRNEDPAVIRRAVMDGVPSAVEVGDRATAIAEGVARLRADDVLLVAGKGHETGQTVAGKVLPFRDHDAVRAALEDRKAS